MAVSAAPIAPVLHPPNPRATTKTAGTRQIPARSDGSRSTISPNPNTAVAADTVRKWSGGVPSVPAPRTRSSAVARCTVQ